MRCLLPVALVLLAGCPTSAPDPLPLPAPRPWPGVDARPALEPALFTSRPALADLSLYVTAVDGPVDDRPGHSHRGAFAVGNGLTFALAGLVDPLNTLHSLVGPTYQRDTSFFSDSALVLIEDGVEAPFVREWAGRPRGTGVFVTRADTAHHALYTVDFAPRPAGVDPLEVPTLIGRVVIVEALDDAGGAVSVAIRTGRAPLLVDGVLTETIDGGARTLGTLPWEATQIVPTAQGPAIPIGALAAGEVAQRSLALVTVEDAADLEVIAAELAAVAPTRWLDDTLAWWAAFSARGVQIETGDPRIADLIDGLRVGIRAQQSAAGGVAPMSQYTGVWLRDNIGPVRFLLRAGLVDEAAAAIDYTYLCALVEGDFSNACDGGLTPDDAPALPPEWETLPAFSGRLSAEGPSYVPLMMREYVRWTGDASRVTERWGWLRRALLGQRRSPEGLQPFSGDETYRVAMSAALGYPLAYTYQDNAWSANSSMLLAVTAEWMAARAAEVAPAEVAAFEALGAEAREALATRFVTDGAYGPFIVRADDTLETQPFEDVNFKPLWLGLLAADDPLAWSNLEALEASAGRGDGRFQSPIAFEHLGSLGLPIYEGVATGMVPGFALWNLTVTGHADIEGAFDHLHEAADGAGQYSEYVVFDDHAAFQPLYDPVGFVGDYTARHRPWEGGINGDAALHYLAGPLEAGPGAIHLRPHLPNGQPRLAMTGLTARGQVVDLVLERAPGRLELLVTSRSSEPIALRVELPVPSDVDAVTERLVDGAPGGEDVSLVGGERLVRFDVVLGPGASTELGLGLR